MWHIPLPMHTNGQSLPLMKLTSSHMCSTFSLHSPEPCAASTMTNRIVEPLNLASFALQSIRERALNFAFPCSKLQTPCDFAWLCWCGLTFNLPKLWTGLLLRPPELGLSAHRRYPFPGPGCIVRPITVQSRSVSASSVRHPELPSFFEVLWVFGLVDLALPLPLPSTVSLFGSRFFQLLFVSEGAPLPKLELFDTVRHVVRHLPPAFGPTDLVERTKRIDLKETVALVFDVIIELFASDLLPLSCSLALPSTSQRWVPCSHSLGRIQDALNRIVEQTHEIRTRDR